MKILVVGASGTLGRAIVDLLGPHHQIISAGRTSGEQRVDLCQDASVNALFSTIGRVDAIISATGSVHFGPLAQMTPAQFDRGLQDKLMGQVRLTLLGQPYLNEGGSITLTTGILAEQPIGQGSNATAVNAALEGFVRAAACELPRGLRINAVSPSVLSQAWANYAAFFPGFEPVSADRAALAFQRSLEGVQTGQIYKVW